MKDGGFQVRRIDGKQSHTHDHVGIALFRQRCTMEGVEVVHNEEHNMSLTAASPHVFSPIDGRETDSFPMVSELTVAQAARFLDVSEGYVHEMLNAGRVLFRQENGERLIDWDNLQHYWKDREHRRAALEEMVRLDQEMGLYDD